MMFCQLREVFRLCHWGDLGALRVGRRGDANKKCFQFASWGV